MERQQEQPLNILAVGALDAQARVLRKDGHSVTIAATLTPDLADGAAQFDLALVDQTVWEQARALIAEASRSKKLVVVLNEEVTEESWREFLGQGAIECFSKQWDEGRLLDELRRFRRYSGVSTERARLLLVIDGVKLGSWQQGFTNRGYEVETADDYEGALRKIEDFEPHVVITDDSLDVNDRHDNAGIQLAHAVLERYQNLIKVVLRAVPSGSTDLNGIRLAGITVVPKRPDSGVDEIEHWIAEKIRDLNLNLSLKVQFEPGQNWNQLAQLIQNNVDRSPKRVAAGIRDLIGKLFSDKVEVKACHPMDSPGGNGTVLVSPIHRHVAKHYFLVKFGKRKTVQEEMDKFKTFVADDLKDPKLELITDAETIYLYGLKFSFSRQFEEVPRDFESFYHDRSTRNDDICRSLSNLADAISEKTYQKKFVSRQDPRELIKYYWEPPKETEQLQDLRREADRLLRAGEYMGIDFEARLGRVRVRIDDESHPLDLAHPVSYVSKLRASLVPTPTQWGVSNASFAGRNLFVDRNLNIWLTDFHRTKPGPILRDFSHLEAIVKFELLKQENFAALVEFEKMLLQPETFRDPIGSSAKIDDDEELAKAKFVITRIRQLAHGQYKRDDIKELYCFLLFRTLRMFLWPGLTAEEKNGHPIRQRYAFLSAAMIATRLEKDFRGWDTIYIV